MAIELYSLGPCPICSDIGDLVALRGRSRTYLWCPVCGATFTRYPGDRVDEVGDILELEPDGVQVATEANAINLAEGTPAKIGPCDPHNRTDVQALLECRWPSG